MVGKRFVISVTILILFLFTTQANTAEKDLAPPDILAALANQTLLEGSISKSGDLKIDDTTIELQEGSRYTIANNQLYLSQAKKITLQGSTISKPTGITITKDRFVLAATAATFSSDINILKGVTNLSIEQQESFHAGSVDEFITGAVTMNKAAGITKSNDDILITSAKSIRSPNLEGTTLEKIVIKNNPESSISILSGQYLNFFLIQVNNFKHLQANQRDRVFTTKNADNITIGYFTFDTIQNSTVKIGGKTSIELTKPSIITLGTQRIEIAPLIGPSIITTETEHRGEPQLYIQHATARFSDETIEITNSATLTVNREFGITCANIEPPGSYTYLYQKAESRFRLVPQSEHSICTHRKLHQKNPKSCTQCTTVDLVTNTLQSKGNLKYQRYLIIPNQPLTEMIDYITPLARSDYTVSWEDDSTTIKLNSWNISTRINNRLLIHDELLDGTPHRKLFITPTDHVSLPLFNKLESPQPLAQIKDMLFTQLTIYNTSIQVDLNQTRTPILFTAIDPDIGSALTTALP
ncbi:MAG: hypothetical protein AABX52_01705 [Nanoarchaeota archaeon]